MRYRPILQRFSEKYEVNPETGCWDWKGSISRNYGYIAGESLGNGKREPNIQAHRFSYIHYVGPVPSGMKVLHSCNNSICVNPKHLRLGSHADNMADLAASGRRIGRGSGARIGIQKLSKLKKLLKTKMTQQQIADQVGIDRSTLQRILKRGDLEKPPSKRTTLTDEQKISAVSMLKAGRTVSFVAASFGVDRKTIRNIRDKAKG